MQIDVVNCLCNIFVHFSKENTHFFPITHPNDLTSDIKNLRHHGKKVAVFLCVIH